MSDRSVAAALRSMARLVVVEAPAGCGKTFQGSEYAREIAANTGDGRVLILTHTHAACDVFSERTRGAGRRVDVRTIDSLISQIGAAYHLPIGLPADTGNWARTKKDGYAKLAAKVACLLRASPMISRSMAMRYPIVICDEHQDASSDQHAVVMALYKAGASIRIFGDPMQRIFESKQRAAIEVNNPRWKVQYLPGMEDFVVEPDSRRWESLKQKADSFVKLDTPHRWSQGSEPLGRWILDARDALESRGQVDLRGTLPPGVRMIVAENQSPKSRGGYKLAASKRKPIHSLVDTANSVLVLATQNDAVHALHTFFFRRLLIWEGHVRNRLSKLVGAIQDHKGDAPKIAEAVVTFLNEVATGFSPSAFGNTFLAEVSDGCVANRRKKSATLQELGRMVIDQPDHKGVAKMLRRLSELRETNPTFKNVKVNYNREFWDAIRLGQFDDPDVGIAELSHRRTYSRPSLPAKAISTVHKAKGLESDNVLIMPCDAKHYSDSMAARCRLYVAMSRAIRSLTLVVSRDDPSPLFLL